MVITREIIEHIAELSRLQLDENDKDEMIIELGKIIAYFDKLKEIDTSNMEAMEYLNMDEVININMEEVTNIKENVLRDDVIIDSYNRKDLLDVLDEETVVDKEKLEYFIVPKIIE